MNRIIPSFDEVMDVTTHISGPDAFQKWEAEPFYKYLIEVPKDGMVLEVGCQLGRSSSIIAQMQKAIGFHSIHIDNYRQQVEWMQSWVEMMHRLGGDLTHEFTLLCMRTEQAAWYLSKIGLIDMALIDGDHEQVSVEIDLRLVANKILPGGILCCHDYANEGLAGVKAAVDPYVSSGRWDEVGIFGSLGIWRRK